MQLPSPRILAPTADVALAGRQFASSSRPSLEFSTICAVEPYRYNRRYRGKTKELTNEPLKTLTPKVMPPQPSPLMTIDLVDPKNRVIGQQRRDQVEQVGGGFRVAHAFLYALDGRLWLQRLAATRDRHPLRWGSSVAAYLFAGETYRQAIVRRIRQELRIQSPALRAVDTVRMVDRNSTKFIGLFSGCLPSPPNSIDRSHIANFTAFDIADIRSMLITDPDHFTPTFRVLFRRAHP